MKRFFRTLSLGVVATCVAATSFAQGQDVTSVYLRNADMEQAAKYWSLQGERLGKNTKRPATQVGFHGVNQGVLEAWHAAPSNPLANSTTMQRMNDLPNGTYVFGAYVGATKQNGRKNVATAGQAAKWEYWSNRDSIYGVSLYANADAVPVATDNPDWGGLGQKWAHSSKFNVATTVTNGILEVGLRVNNTNANYVVWDNATLYYFGDMSEAEALDAMAEIDMTNAAAIADTLVAYKMNVDTLANLEAAIAEVKKEATTAATLWDDNENLFWAMGQARKSITDYENLKKHIESAIVVKNGTWSEDGMDWYYKDLVDAIEEAEEAYEEAEMNRTELTELRATLSQMVGWMRVDSLYIAREALLNFINTPGIFTGGPGKYSVAQQNQLKALDREVADSLYVVEDMWPDARPQDLYPYIARIYEAIENVKNNPIALEYTLMPIEFKPAADGEYKGWIEGAEWHSQADRIIAYNSPMYLFESKIETFRITVNKSKNNAAYFCLSELTFFDGNGDVIPLTEENLSTPYDHNTLNPGAPDGGGIAALFDGDNDTYFHSAWQNSPAGHHYLDVVLPNGGYDAFSFQMLSRSNSNGWDQSHTFPGEMVLSTPMPERDALKDWIASAKNLNPYSFPEVGYYVKDFSYLTDVIAEAEALIESNPTEEDCFAMTVRLREAVLTFEADEDKAIRMPEAGKAYRIVSAFPSFYEKQRVEKAMTVHATDTTTTLWWENLAADRLQQEFVFEPILNEDGDHYMQIESVEEFDGTTWIEEFETYYCYYMKHVETGCYVDYEDFRTFRLVEEPADTVMLYSLGRGQWNIIVSDYDEFGASMSKRCMHAEEHNNGDFSTRPGMAGGTYGVSSCICSYFGGIDTPSAWYIYEYPTLPLEVAVEGTEFKSEFYHFEAANTVILTADKACAFEGLTLYDRNDVAIAIDSLVISGNIATIVQDEDFVACAFAFTNNEGVNSVTFGVTWTDPIPAVAYLQEAYDYAVAFAPVQGTEVGQFADLTAYNLAVGKADSILASGVTTHEEAQAMIEQLEAAVAGLVPNMPEAGRMYYIINAMETFAILQGVDMMMYDNEQGELCWTYEDLYSLNRCWTFEQATEEELEAVGMPAEACAYYIKNVATGLYIGNAERMSVQVYMAADKAETVPYAVTVLSGKEIALDGLGNQGKRLHANSHGSGAGRGSNIVYWSSGTGTASAWRICDAEAYGLSYFATYSMEAQAVEATQASVVNIPIAMTNTTKVTGFQFDLYLPEGVTAVSTMEDSTLIYDITLNGERAENTHVVNAWKQADGALRVQVHSTTGAPFVGSAGVVVNVAVSVGRSVAAGEYPVTLRNIRLEKTDAKEELCDDHTATLTVLRGTLLGDVNSDGQHTMADVVMMVNAVLEIEQANFAADVADMNGDGAITMADVVAVLRLVLGYDSVAAARSARRSEMAVPVLSAEQPAAMGNGNVVLPVALNNRADYSAFQLDVVLPSGVELAEATLTGRAKAGHAVAWNTLTDGSVRVVAYAMDNAAFRGSEGALLNLVLKTSDALSADAEVVLTEGLFATANGAEHRAADVSVMMRAGTTGIDAAAAGFRVYGAEKAVIVECAADTVLSIYGAAGQLVEQTVVKAGKTAIALPAGVYVINGNKVIVK